MLRTEKPLGFSILHIREDFTACQGNGCSSVLLHDRTVGASVKRTANSAIGLRAKAAGTGHGGNVSRTGRKCVSGFPPGSGCQLPSESPEQHCWSVRAACSDEEARVPVIKNVRIGYLVIAARAHEVAIAGHCSLLGHGSHVAFLSIFLPCKTKRFY